MLPECVQQLPLLDEVADHAADHSGHLGVSIRKGIDLEVATVSISEDVGVIESMESFCNGCNRICAVRIPLSAPTDRQT